MSRRRVVVTGTSVITSLGFELDDVWERICSGHSGIGPVLRFDCSEFAVQFGGEIRKFDLCDHMSIERRDVKRIDRFCQFAFLAAHTAIEESGIDFSDHDPYRSGVIIGSGIGGLDEIELQHSRLFDRGPDRISAYMIPRLIINAPSGVVSVRWGLRGPNSAVVTACASGTNAIGDAFRMIRSGTSDVMVAGGCEAALTPMGIAGFARMNALSTRNDAPELASRPFDVDRDGFVLSEGAGMVVLEELEFAKARGANILAEVLGYGMTADASHPTAPDKSGRGAARAIVNAMQDGEINPEDVGYINAHSTSTPRGDQAEATAIHLAFGERAKTLPVSSTKGHLGHLLGASGSVESVFCINAIRTDVLPQTLNLDQPDPKCELRHIRGQPMEQRVNITLKNSFGFGGHNACLAFGRFH